MEKKVRHLGDFRYVISLLLLRSVLKASNYKTTLTSHSSQSPFLLEMAVNLLEPDKGIVTLTYHPHGKPSVRFINERKRSWPL